MIVRGPILACRPRSDEVKRKDRGEPQECMPCRVFLVASPDSEGSNDRTKDQPDIREFDPDDPLDKTSVGKKVPAYPMVFVRDAERVAVCDVKILSVVVPEERRPQASDTKQPHTRIFDRTQ